MSIPLSGSLSVLYFYNPYIYYIFWGIYSSDNESNGINEKKYKSRNVTIKDKD